MACAASAAGLRIVAPAQTRPRWVIDRRGAHDRARADDVRALLDGLEIKHTSVFGWSMGGQYTLACAARLADRVTRAVVVGWGASLHGRPNISAS